MYGYSVEGLFHYVYAMNANLYFLDIKSIDANTTATLTVGGRLTHGIVEENLA